MVPNYTPMPGEAAVRPPLGDARKNAYIKLHPNARAARGARGRPWDLGASAAWEGMGPGRVQGVGMGLGRAHHKFDWVACQA